MHRRYRHAVEHFGVTEMKRKLLPLLLIASLLLCACGKGTENTQQDLPGEPSHAQNTVSEEPTPPPEPEKPPAMPALPVLSEKELAVNALMEDMCLEEKVGQLFFVRCPSEQAVEDVSAYHLGGYLLFGRDFADKEAESIKDTIAAYQAAADIPLLIGVDEEGGSVVRISSNSALWPHKFRSPQRLFADGGLGRIKEDTAEKCAMLRTYGVNVNFAPVADVSTSSGDFIYSRTLGQSAEATAEYVSTVVETMNTCENAPIGSVLKHFPGYGSNVDTHTGIAVDARSYESFLQCDFLPFSAGINAGAGSVLVSHNIVNCMDPSLPASLSGEVHRVLREELGFDGVILTDDLAMDAVEAYAADGSVAVLAVKAGNDMIVTGDYRTQIPLVIAAAESGEIDEAMIDEAVRRVLSWKYDLGLIG